MVNQIQEMQRKVENEQNGEKTTGSKERDEQFRWCST